MNKKKIRQIKIDTMKTLITAVRDDEKQLERCRREMEQSARIFVMIENQLTNAKLRKMKYWRILTADEQDRVRIWQETKKEIWTR